MCQLRVAVHAALWAKQEDVEKARRLEQVWAVTIDDLISTRATCEQLRSIGSAAPGPPSSPTDLACLVDGVSALAARMLDRITAATAKLADASGQTSHAG
jgi:hypothetical protein